MTNRRLRAARTGKLLGTPAGGGRRRAVKAFKVRTSAFKKNIPRIHVLRRAGVRTAQLTRTAGTPAVMYGVECTGISNSHLQDTRSAIARAAAAGGSGKNPDLILYAIDAATGTLDPAFDAHVLPIQAWALAWWQGWRAHAVLRSSFNYAVRRLEAKGNNCWAVVSGPVAAMVASARRIG
eukprot:7760172-Karenia_brevis.AAC.1